jgi:hypothetical protein
MTSFNIIDKLLRDEGFRVQKRFYKWGIEVVAEKHGFICTINVYRNGDNKILLEASSIVPNKDFTVDIKECNCNAKELDSCIHELLSSLNELILA